MSQYFPRPYESFGRDINVKVDFSNYSKKTDLKNIAMLILQLNKLINYFFEKLVPVPVDLSKLSNVVKNEVVKKTVYDKLVAKINNIDTSRFILKTKYDAGKLELEKKIPDVSNLVKKSDYNVKVNEIEGKIQSTSGLAATSALTSVKNKIPSVSPLVKKNRL